MKKKWCFINKSLKRVPKIPNAYDKNAYKYFSSTRIERSCTSVPFVWDICTCHIGAVVHIMELEFCYAWLTWLSNVAINNGIITISITYFVDADNCATRRAKLSPTRLWWSALNRSIDTYSSLPTCTNRRVQLSRLRAVRLKLLYWRIRYKREFCYIFLIIYIFDNTRVCARARVCVSVCVNQLRYLRVSAKRNLSSP